MAVCCCCPGRRYYDLYHGHAFGLSGQPVCIDGLAIVRFHLEALGYGAILRVDQGAPAPSDEFQARMRYLSRTELRTFSNDFQFLRQAIVPNPTTPLPTAPDNPPPDMVRLRAGMLDFDAQYGGRPSPGVPFTGDVQFPWEPAPRTRHRQLMQMHEMWMDRHPVTNEQYAAYVLETGYRPQFDQNWLKHFDAEGRYPEGWANKPVIWVSRQDAAAYCQHYGKRLPHTWEWQWAAQGGQFAPPRNSDSQSSGGANSTASSAPLRHPHRRRMDEAPPPPAPGQGRAFPWGNQDDPSRYPPRANNFEQPPPADVGLYPSGASAFGVQDMMYHLRLITTRTGILN
jgi:iron(II)-dependent oxidoreductase